MLERKEKCLRKKKLLKGSRGERGASVKTKGVSVRELGKLQKRRRKVYKKAG
jgi:hypothetical protein